MKTLAFLFSLYFLLTAQAHSKCKPLVRNSRSTTSVNFIAFGDSQLGHKKDRNVSTIENGNRFQVRALNRIFDGSVYWPKSFKRPNSKIKNVRGVLIAGDVTEDAWFRQWDAFENRYYGLCGQQRVDGVRAALKYPVYEGYGNHDFLRLQHRGPREAVIEAIGERNHFRADTVRIAENHRAHYSWKWDNVHFINVNVKPGSKVEEVYYPSHCGKTKDCGELRRLVDPHKSLKFLKYELKNVVKNKKTPVVIMTHYPPYNERMKVTGANEEIAFYNAIKGYNVIAIVAGHTHKSTHRKWRGIDVFEVGGPFYKNKTSSYAGHFTLFRITNSRLMAQDIQWTPENERNSRGERKLKLRVNRGWSFSKPIVNPRKN